MSLDFLATLEARVEQAAAELAAQRERNAELSARVAELERELADPRAAEAPEGRAWEAERAELRRRVERLASRLEELLEA
jgi:chromosome segregation ATPase